MILIPLDADSEIFNWINWGEMFRLESRCVAQADGLNGILHCRIQWFSLSREGRSLKELVTVQFSEEALM